MTLVFIIFMLLAITMVTIKIWYDFQAQEVNHATYKEPVN